MDTKTQTGSFERRDVEFNSGDTTCSGWLFVPDGASSERPVPAVVMAPGLGSLKEMGLAPVAEAFAERGIATLLFDYRHWGASGGEPREHLVPNAQIDDYRNALTFLALRPEVDAARLGVWGVSFSGGHVLHVAAYDARVKVVVSLTPAVDVYLAGQQRFAPELQTMFSHLFAEERKRLYTGGEHQYVPLAAPDPDSGAVMGAESYAWQERYRTTTVPQFENRMTLDSLERLSEYAPGLSIARIAPRPLLVIVATRDQAVVPALTYAAFEQAGYPKQLIELDCGHYDVYEGEHRRTAIDASAKWFGDHL